MSANISGTIATGGTAQTLKSWASDDSHVTGYYLQNLDTSVTLYVREDGTAASAGSGSIAIPPGALYESPDFWPGKQRPDPLSVFSTKTGHAFTARWF